LKQEESKSASIGFTAKIPEGNITLTDAYIVRIDDRVTLTDQFSRPSGTFAAGTPQRELQLQFDLAGANAIPFANAINTESKGIDIIVTHKLNLGAM
jgi:iron complex outermembrane receptor protein